MIETSVAAEAQDIRDEQRDAEEREDGRDGLYDVLAALPLIDRVELIERMAEQMGV